MPTVSDDVNDKRPFNHLDGPELDVVGDSLRRGTGAWRSSVVTGTCWQASLTASMTDHEAISSARLWLTSSSHRHCRYDKRHLSMRQFNPLMVTGNYSATSNNTKLVHWPLMGGLLHLVQRWGDWAGPQPAQAARRCAKCNSPPINCQFTNHRIAL